ncbi:MAG: hypothetical protein HRT43_01455 [Campylobacteraceae bacterium]|nr:hypothetical protein [Campylobacteraceae bacterium]
MESKISIDVYGLTEISSLLIAENILSIIKSFDKLDLRRLSNVVVTDEFDNIKTKKSNEFKDFTNALSYAKVVIVPKDDDYEFIIALRSDFGMYLVEENINSMNHSNYLNALHVLHHELCHVHDYNQCIDIFHSDFFGLNKRGKEMMLYPLSQICWSEYIANYLSSPSAKKCDMLRVSIDSLMIQITETEIKIDRQIQNFRVDKDIKSLLLFVKTNIENLVKSASYVLGYMHGLNKDIKKFCPDLYEHINNSYFYYTWNYLDDVLETMRSKYPKKWNEEEIFDNLIYGFDRLYVRLGIRLTENKKQELFFEVHKRG